jgi:hypothetical protein
MLRCRDVLAVLLLTPAVLVGCAGTFDYTPPSGPLGSTYARVVGQSKEEVWRHLIPAIDKEYLVIDRLDKDTGAITVTYRGDPEWYVDCGRIVSQVKNLRGERTYRFPAAAASAQYEVVRGTEILVVDRRMTLEGRLTVSVVAINGSQTQVSANAHYALTRVVTTRDTTDRAQTLSHVVDFGSGHEAAFPGAVTCRPTGMLENEVLSALGP